MDQQWILISGGTGGIGQAIALRLAQDGYSIILHYNSNRETAKICEDKIRELGGNCQLVSFDIADSQAIEQKLDPLFENLAGSFVGLVNNAGIHRDSMAGLMSDEMFDQVMQINLYGSFYLTRYAVKKMIRKRQGSIVNIASLAGQVGNPGQINYSASKAGIMAMTKTLAQEIAKRNIRVNCVAPGLIETSMLDEIPHMAKMMEKIPMGRLGQPQEVAGAVSFLFSKDSSYMTGQTLSVNGGLLPT